MTCSNFRINTQLRSLKWRTYYEQDSRGLELIEFIGFNPIERSVLGFGIMKLEMLIYFLFRLYDFCS